MGALRRLFEERGVSCQNLSVDVFFEPRQDPRQRDRIVISINVDHDPVGVDAETIKAVATSGGVTSRMTLGSEVDVRIAKVRAYYVAKKIRHGTFSKRVVTQATKKWPLQGEYAGAESAWVSYRSLMAWAT